MNVAFSQLESASMYVEEYGNDFLKGTIDLPEGQDLIFTTIPYDEGWRVYIDGERAEITEVLDSLLAVQSTAGFHEIEFVYRPNCAVYGGLISIIGILVFALLVIWSRSRKARALVKCDNTRTEHFFYCKGDDTTGWLTEASETEAAAAGGTGAGSRQRCGRVRGGHDGKYAGERSAINFSLSCGIAAGQLCHKLCHGRADWRIRLENGAFCIEQLLFAYESRGARHRRLSCRCRL